jgi:hypothetical protein
MPKWEPYHSGILKTHFFSFFLHSLNKGVSVIFRKLSEERGQLLWPIGSVFFLTSYFSHIGCVCGACTCQSMGSVRTILGHVALFRAFKTMPLFLVFFFVSFSNHLSRDCWHIHGVRITWWQSWPSGLGVASLIWVVPEELATVWICLGARRCIIMMNS